MGDGLGVRRGPVPLLPERFRCHRSVSPGPAQGAEACARHGPSRVRFAAFLRTRTPSPTREATRSGLAPQPSTGPPSPGAQGTLALPRPAGLGEAALTEQEHQVGQSKGSRGHGASAGLAGRAGLLRLSGTVHPAVLSRPLPLTPEKAPPCQPARDKATPPPARAGAAPPSARPPLARRRGPASPHPPAPGFLGICSVTEASPWRGVRSPTAAPRSAGP